MPGIELHTFSEQGLETMLRQSIVAKLSSDKDALKEINVDAIIPQTVADARIMDRDFPQGLFRIKGLLALDDSGIGMKYFDFNIEQGLHQGKDQEIADQLAFQCFACVAQMKRDRKKNPNRRKLIIA